MLHFTRAPRQLLVPDSLVDDPAHGKTFDIALDRLYRNTRFNLIEFCQVRTEHDLVVSDQKNPPFDYLDGHRELVGCWGFGFCRHVTVAN